MDPVAEDASIFESLALKFPSTRQYQIKIITIPIHEGITFEYTPSDFAPPKKLMHPP